MASNDRRFVAVTVAKKVDRVCDSPTEAIAPLLARHPTPPTVGLWAGVALAGNPPR